MFILTPRPVRLSSAATREFAFLQTQFFKGIASLRSAIFA